MADWDPTNAEDWARQFGLVALPYFSQNRKDTPDGTHLMMQDGGAASFALHIPKQSALLTGTQPLEWAWSAHVRHAVIIDPQTRNAVIRRWDDPAYLEDRQLTSNRVARRFIHELENLPKPIASVSGPDVITSTLQAFGELRNAIEQEYRGTDTDVVLAFNVALLLAERWRSNPKHIPNIRLADA